MDDFRALLVGCESHFLVFQDWQMIIKFFLKIFAFIVMIASSGAYAADFDAGRELDKHCSSEYKQVDDFLQYLYKVDGNLKDLNPSKIKRIEHLEAVFRDRKTIKPQRSEAFRELFGDPDWWVYKLQRDSKKLIAQLELLKKNSSWDQFKKLASEQVAGKISKLSLQPSATNSMNAMVDLMVGSAEFFSERNEIKERLKALGASSRLSRVFSEDSQQDSFESKFLLLYLPSSLIKCQIDFLETRLNTKR